MGSPKEIGLADKSAAPESTQVTDQKLIGETGSSSEGPHLADSTPFDAMDPEAVIQSLIGNFAARLTGEAGKKIVPSIPELIRLFQFRSEIEENTVPDRIDVRWIDWDGRDSKL
jgi:hypothetical protein